MLQLKQQGKKDLCTSTTLKLQHLWEEGHGQKIPSSKA